MARIFVTLLVNVDAISLSSNFKYWKSGIH